MKEKDILDDFLESSEEKPPLKINVTSDGFTIILSTNENTHETLSEEDKEKARVLALEKLEASRKAFLDFTDITNTLSTLFVLSAAITSFAEFASGLTEFISNPQMTEEEFEETELSEFIMYETAEALTEEFLYDCHKELIENEKDN